MDSNKKVCVLIAGGSGLIGTRLTALLKQKGITVMHLSRKVNAKSSVPVIFWDPSKGKLENEKLDDVTQVINLAGTPIAEKRWTNEVKKDILQSRLDSVHTLLSAIQQQSNIQSIIGASAIGYYGDRGVDVLYEGDKPGSGFLADTVVKWEAAYASSTVRTVLLRTGIVLSRNGGALPPMARPVHAGLAPIIGDQYMSWIHIDDVCRMYIHALTNTTWSGIYNATAPSPLQGREFVKMLQKVINPYSIRLKVPEWFLKLLLGEQSELVLDSANVSCDKALAEGFTFNFSNAEAAVRSLYGK